MSCSGGRCVILGGEKSLTFKIPPLKEAAYVQIVYINVHKNPVIVELGMNGQIPTKILFPTTGGGEEVGTVMIAVDPAPGARENTLTFTTPCAPGPALESISVLAGAH